MRTNGQITLKEYVAGYQKARSEINLDPLPIAEALLLEVTFYRMGFNRTQEKSSQYQPIDIERLCAQHPPVKSCGRVMFALDFLYSDNLSRPKSYDDGHLIELLVEYLARPKKPKCSRK